MTFERIAWEQLLQMHQDQLFERKVSITIPGKHHKAANLLRYGHQGAQAALVRLALKLQREGKASIGDERKGMGRINRQRRDHGKDMGQEILQQIGVILFRLRCGQNLNILLRHFFAQIGKNRLLLAHQIARFAVDELQLLRDAAPVYTGRDAARAGQFAQTGDAHRIKFVQIGGGN